MLSDNIWHLAQVQLLIQKGQEISLISGHFFVVRALKTFSCRKINPINLGGEGLYVPRQLRGFLKP